jgi:hypothetical protein
MTQAELDIFVVNSQCCVVKKTVGYITAKNNGDFGAEKLYYEWLQLNVLVASIKNYDYVNSTCFTEEEICSIIEMIKRMCSDCGC